MSRRPGFNEQEELHRIREQEMLLLKRERESAEHQRRLALELREQERTMPPLEEILERKRYKQHEMTISRGEIVNIRRTETRSVLLLVLLLAATCSLVWWGFQIMQGG